MLTREALLQGYRLAGTDFLADRLEGMFRHIATEQDKALHNAVLEEVISMIGDDSETQKRFFRVVAYRLSKERKRKSFVKIVAERLRKLKG